MTADTKEVHVVGKIEINKRPMRVKVYEIIDEVNLLDKTVWKRYGVSPEVRKKFKKIITLLNAL